MVRQHHPDDLFPQKERLHDLTDHVKLVLRGFLALPADPVPHDPPDRSIEVPIHVLEVHAVERHEVLRHHRLDLSLVLVTALKRPQELVAEGALVDLER